MSETPIEDRCDVCGGDGGEHGLAHCIGFVTPDGHEAERICLHCAQGQLTLWYPMGFAKEVVAAPTS